MRLHFPYRLHEALLVNSLTGGDITLDARQVAEGLIWVWGSGGASEYSRAAAKRPNVTREIDDLPEGSKVTEVFKTYTRELPYDWQVRDPPPSPQRSMRYACFTCWACPACNAPAFQTYCKSEPRLSFFR
jgi:hypothetical protein